MGLRHRIQRGEERILRQLDLRAGLHREHPGEVLRLPGVLIWSQSTVCVCEMEKAIRWSVTTVTWVGGEKHPPHARAGRAGASSEAAASAASET